MSEESTTPDLVELARRTIDRSARGDLDGTFRGRDRGDAYVARLSDAWEEFRTVAEDVRDLGDRVLILGQVEGHGKGSGVPVNMPLAQVYDFRDGKVCRIRSYLDHGEVLEAVGLEG